ncbi:hypothetical protein HOK68_01270 [Candidatus Woesearchaeota archaeon]|jgi:hypothetical protein|nr:hypothetical protein [Candidatus Woesearchaeota archaeon]MBT4387425.1 hypothetical protein [Candidatus Woesearchaeota archaeon]MBT4595802.1 hypothetical protein [Candidatus Woesearchaeota archaeon]MBT5741349.1 hypothetical protein [Candidatus Woesearchaeota archaeon]MBT6505391.1 hypothetical protein [Candidatus Woesearchaeota archaeon]
MEVNKTNNLLDLVKLLEPDFKSPLYTEKLEEFFLFIGKESGIEIMYSVSYHRDVVREEGNFIGISVSSECVGTMCLNEYFLNFNLKRNVPYGQFNGLKFNLDIDIMSAKTYEETYELLTNVKQHIQDYFSSREL